MFSPYHKFSNCSILEYHINQLIKNGRISQVVQMDHNNYHFALTYKLKCAKDYLDDLRNILTNTPPGDVSTNTNAFSFRVNKSIDGFFYSSGSSLDILAREILSYYGQTANRIYFSDALRILSPIRTGDPILTRLTTPNWKQLFSDYRNTLTHELIIANKFDIRLTINGNVPVTETICYLPDNPRTRPENRTFNQNINALEYMEKNFTRIVSLINQIYNVLISNIKNMNQMPL